MAVCSSNIKNVEMLKNENMEFKQKNIQLENDIRELTAKIDNIRKNSVNNHSNPIESDEGLNLSKKEEETLGDALSDSDEKSHFHNMFDPFNLNVGDKVGNFTVKKLDTSNGLESVDFEGSFTVTGDLLTNDTGSSAFSIIIKRDQIYNIPCSIHEIDDDKVFINITNSKDEVISLLGKSYTEPDAGDEFIINITATFSEYKYRYKYETDITSTAKLTKLISINK